MDIWIAPLADDDPAPDNVWIIAIVTIDIRALPEDFPIAPKAFGDPLSPCSG